MTLDPYLGFAKAAGIIAAAVVLFTLGHHYGAQGERLKAADAASKEFAATQATERTLRGQIDTLTATAGKERDDAQATINDLRARVRTGAVRLSVPARCPAPDGAGVGPEATRAELVPAVADDLIGIAADGDDAVRDLNECIAKYGAVSHALAN